MRIVLFCHSLVSDWNNGNAHFLRGVMSELQRRGHDVVVYEPRRGWSLTNLCAEFGDDALRPFHLAYPTLSSRFYAPADIDLDAALDGANLVLVHEWTDGSLLQRLGMHRRGKPYRLLFHDTHHRSITDPASLPVEAIAACDGVLAFGDVIRRIYSERGWARRAWTWHEAADIKVFRPVAADAAADLVWVGNWGDEERTRELQEFLLEPVRTLGIRATVHGVRYPAEAQAMLAAAGIVYGGYLPNPEAPAVFARHRVTVHVPRRPYAEALPGIPTIRVFEALACGIPLVSAPWQDSEALFTPGRDFLVAADGAAMRRHLATLLHEPDLGRALAEHGRNTVMARHTCAHRVDELMTICEELGLATQATKESSKCAAD